MIEYAKEQYAALGVDVESALDTLAATPISLHCWQGDDVCGFEGKDGDVGGGLAVTGNHPGKARTLDELRRDMEKVLSLLPGRHRVNIHASYADFQGEPVDRDALEPAHFESWIQWCESLGVGMDFNPTCFGHPMAESGLTLSSGDAGVRSFWVEHCRRSRRIGAMAGERLGSPCVTNIWIPDGMKDQPADRRGARERLAASLDEVLGEKIDPSLNRDAVECKLFGIGSESFVVGSHEFYFGYAVTRGTVLCLDAGHFHPTESVADKISSALLYVPELLLHVSRGVRWDSDHVVIFDDQTRAIMEELVRSDALGRAHIGLDFFDASINRIAAWLVGTRAAQKCLLFALLEPRGLLREAEEGGDYTRRLALFEQAKAMPWGMVWDAFCARHGVPTDARLLDEVAAYERSELAGRG